MGGTGGRGGKKWGGLGAGRVAGIGRRTREKDRNRRYETANAFAADVQRFLADEPVQACPPSTTYRLKKFLRRYRRPVLAAIAVILALVGGIVGTSLGLVRAERALQAQAERAEGERQAKLAPVAAAQAEEKAEETAQHPAA